MWTTGNQVLSRDLHIFPSMNAYSVLNSANSSKCPTWTTISLITNLSNCGALWPFYPCIKLFRQFFWINLMYLFGKFDWAMRRYTRTCKSADCIYRSFWIKIMTGLLNWKMLFFKISITLKLTFQVVLLELIKSIISWELIWTSFGTIMRPFSGSEVTNEMVTNKNVTNRFRNILKW